MKYEIDWLDRYNQEKGTMKIEAKGIKDLLHELEVAAFEHNCGTIDFFIRNVRSEEGQYPALFGSLDSLLKRGFHDEAIKDAENMYGGIPESRLRQSKDFKLKEFFSDLDEEKSKPNSVARENNIQEIKMKIEKRLKEIKNVPNDVYVHDSIKDASSEKTATVKAILEEFKKIATSEINATNIEKVKSAVISSSGDSMELTITTQYVDKETALDYGDTEDVNATEGTWLSYDFKRNVWEYAFGIHTPYPTYKTLQQLCKEEHHKYTSTLSSLEKKLLAIHDSAIKDGKDVKYKRATLYQDIDGNWYIDGFGEVYRSLEEAKKGVDYWIKEGIHFGDAAINDGKLVEPSKELINKVKQLLEKAGFNAEFKGFTGSGRAEFYIMSKEHSFTANDHDALNVLGSELEDVSNFCEKANSPATFNISFNPSKHAITGYFHVDKTYVKDAAIKDAWDIKPGAVFKDKRSGYDGGYWFIKVLKVENGIVYFQGMNRKQDGTFDKAEIEKMPTDHFKYMLQGRYKQVNSIYDSEEAEHKIDVKNMRIKTQYEIINYLEQHNINYKVTEKDITVMTDINSWRMFIQQCGSQHGVKLEDSKTDFKKIHKIVGLVKSIKDDHLSPMTYKKLKELGYDADSWKDLSQEQANEIIRKGEKKGAGKSGKREEVKADIQQKINRDLKNYGSITSDTKLAAERVGLKIENNKVSEDVESQKKAENVTKKKEAEKMKTDKNGNKYLEFSSEKEAKDYFNANDLPDGTVMYGNKIYFSKQESKTSSGKKEQKKQESTNARIELDFDGSESDAKKLAKQFGCDVKWVNSANGYPVFRFTGPIDKLKRLTKKYGMDAEDFEEFVEKEPKNEESKQLTKQYKKLTRYYDDEDIYDPDVDDIVEEMLEKYDKDEEADSLDDIFDKLSSKDKEAVIEALESAVEYHKEYGDPRHH